MPIKKIIQIFYFFLFCQILNCSSSAEFAKSNYSGDKLSGIFATQIFPKKSPNEDKNNHTYFDKESFVFKILNIQPAKDNSFEVIEKDIYFFSYKETFLSKVSSIFKGKKPEKYFIKQAVKIGKGIKVNSETLSVEYKQFYTRQAEGDSLLLTLQKFSASKKNGEFQSKSTKVYTMIEENILWNLEEQYFIDSFQSVQWKNFPTTIYSPALTETIIKKQNPEITRINDPEKFAFTKNNNTIPLIFQNKIYSISLNLGETEGFPKESNSGFFETKYYFEKYENPFIIYKSKETKE